ncbi:helix-turn-helix domain-containing protein [Actinotalea ferrariae]|uniref:helix-turn-helix domain-containing protein n=1 Tax=Actinotalea ferrariae TaxID=1386098 RepID=UPI0027E1A105|nr:helix-turn-helix transcriptional regulator [Actinotalea ferrariae]
MVSHLGTLLEDRGMTLVQLAAASGITVANLSVLKNGRARAIRFSTLTAICDVLQCQPGDVLEVSGTHSAPPPTGDAPEGVSPRSAAAARARGPRRSWS